MVTKKKKNLLLLQRKKNQSPLNVSLIVFKVPPYHHHSCPCLEISDGLERQTRKSPEFWDNTFKFFWKEVSNSQQKNQVVITVKQSRKYIYIYNK